MIIISLFHFCLPFQLFWDIFLLLAKLGESLSILLWNFFFKFCYYWLVELSLAVFLFHGFLFGFITLLPLPFSGLFFFANIFSCKSQLILNFTHFLVNQTGLSPRNTAWPHPTAYGHAGFTCVCSCFAFVVSVVYHLNLLPSGCIWLPLVIYFLILLHCCRWCLLLSNFLRPALISDPWPSTETVPCDWEEHVFSTNDANILCNFKVRGNLHT